MRKFLLTALLAGSCAGVFAQKLDDVQEKISKGKYDEAKEKIDKVLADPKNAGNANAWYYKGKVYAELARTDSAGTLGYDAGQQAFEAFKKYQELDKKNIMMTLDQNVGLFQLYDMYYNQGIKSYNAKDYGKAFDKMKNALSLEEYIAKRNYSYNNFSFPALDTQMINLTASSAYLAKREAESMPYFEKLADAKLRDKEYKNIYSLLAQYYIDNGNQAKADKYLALGKELFPGDDWVSLEFGNPGEDLKKQIDKYRDDLNAATSDAAKKDLQAKIDAGEAQYSAVRVAKYEQLLAKYPDNYALAMDYAIELFNETYSSDKRPADYPARQDKTQKALEKALAIDPNSSLANYVMSQHLYNQIYDFDDAIRAIKGNTPADQAKRKDLNAKENAKYEEMFKYAQKSYDLFSAETTLKAQDKANYRKVINQLVDYYQRKKQADKVTMLQAKLKTL